MKSTAIIITKWFLTCLMTSFLLAGILKLGSNIFNDDIYTTYWIPVEEEIRIVESYLTPGLSDISISGKVQLPNSLQDTLVNIIVEFYIDDKYAGISHCGVRTQLGDNDQLFFRVALENSIPRDSVDGEISWRFRRCTTKTSKEEYNDYYTNRKSLSLYL